MVFKKRQDPSSAGAWVEGAQALLCTICNLPVNLHDPQEDARHTINAEPSVPGPMQRTGHPLPVQVPAGLLLRASEATARPGPCSNRS